MPAYLAGVIEHGPGGADRDPESGGALDACDFWIARGDGTTVSAVCPGSDDTWYARWRRECLQDWTLARMRRHLGARCRRAVDLGCGYGDWTVQLAALAHEVIACDVSPGFVEQTRARLRVAGHTAAQVTVADVRRFDDYRDADLICLGAVLMYLEDEDCRRLLRRVRERIAGDGLFVSRDWCALRLGRAGAKLNPWFSVHRRARNYREMIEQAGFRVIESATSPAVYGELVAARLLARGRDQLIRWLRWPAALPWYVASLAWTRGSVTFVMRPS